MATSDTDFGNIDDRISEFQEDVLVNAAVAQGADLRDYARQIAADLSLVEDIHILEYVEECRALVDLFKQVESCDNILGTMDLLLSGFQADLSNISTEIQTLQEKSQTMGIKLKNRLSVQQKLSEVLDGAVVSPDLIKKISEGEVNDFFIQHLRDLNSKMTFVKSQQGKHILAVKDVAPELERLRLKACEKIRDFFIKKIESLKAPNTNICIIQQNVFLKFKELYWFLLERYPDVANEVRQSYISTVSNYYLASFEKYVNSVKRLQTVIADKLDLMGLEESAKRGIFTGKLTLKDKTNVYTLGDRVNVITTPDSGIILPHIAEDQNLKYTYESLFKSIHRLLIDNASSEYIFDLEFFTQKPKFGRETQIPAAIFQEIFDPTLKLLLGTTKLYTETSYDAVGILLCIRLNSQHLMIMQKRRIPSLDNFLNATNMLLWPRFQMVVSTHVDSLRKAVAAKLVPNKDVHPHYITRRYAEFAVSILTLNQGFDDALIGNSLQRVRTEVEALLFRMAGEIPDRKNRNVFLINNYDLLLAILSEYSLPAFETEKQFFQKVLENKTAEFVEEELKPHIGEVIKFVNEAELDENLEKISADRFERTATDFNNTWKPAISNINTSVITSFPNFQNGARVLHAVLTQLLLYYKRFLTLWEKKFHFNKQRVTPVGMQIVIVEIKKFRSTF